MSLCASLYLDCIKSYSRKTGLLIGPPMTYSDLNIDLSEMITEELRLGFLKGIEFRLSHLFISFHFRDSGGGLKSTPAPRRGLPGGAPRRGLTGIPQL